MAHGHSYKNNYLTYSPGTGLPEISQGLDSVRTYQFELHFELPPDLLDTAQDKLTLAAKQVTSLGFASEPIEVHRVNDKVYYPGKATPEELSVTFDNLYQPKISNLLWSWFSSIYDPTTGKFNTVREGGLTRWKAQRATIVSLDPHGQPLMETRLFGVFPISWQTAEFNYGTNEFHTIEMKFKYDFMEHVTAGESIPGGALVG